MTWDTQICMTCMGCDDVQLHSNTQAVLCNIYTQAGYSCILYIRQLYNCIESLINKLIIMEETTEKWEDVMLAKLEKQKQEFIKAYIKTYGEYPKCYVNDKGK